MIDYNGRRETRDFEDIANYLFNLETNYRRYVVAMDWPSKIIYSKFSVLMKEFKAGDIDRDTLCSYLKEIRRYLQNNPDMDRPMLNRKELEAVIKEYLG